MTAIVGILNKQGMAVAADSAATIGGGMKVFNTANKLFALSKHHPVGIAVYGTATFNGYIPWEIIIKEYRKTLKEKCHNSTADYMKDFYNFLYDFQKKHITKDQIIAFLNYDVYGMYERIFKKNGRLKEAGVIIRTINLIKDNTEPAGKASEKKEYLCCISSSLGKIKEELSKILKFEEIENALIDILFSSRNNNRKYHPYMSGLAFFGYGQDEIYPSIIDTNVYASLPSKICMREKTKEAISNENSQIILPLAQTDVIQTFLYGMDAETENVFYNGIKYAILKIVSQMEGIIRPYNEVIANNIKNMDLNPLYDSINSIMGDYKRRKYVEPLLNMISLMDKADLAVVAENLIYMTSLRRHVAYVPESVGGPIDVAVLSKGDGFIWVKRKHYFDPKLNFPYFEKYLNN